MVTDKNCSKIRNWNINKQFKHQTYIVKFCKGYHIGTHELTAYVSENVSVFVQYNFFYFSKNFSKLPSYYRYV